jgi:hypothetical protein
MATPIIRVNDEGRKAVEELCDAALKVGGLRNLPRTVEILRGIEMIPSAEKPELGELTDGKDSEAHAE